MHKLFGEYDLTVDYQDDDPKGDWFITITVPKQKEWYDTKTIAIEIAKTILKRCNK